MANYKAIKYDLPATANFAGITVNNLNIVSDETPQLGGNLDGRMAEYFHVAGIPGTGGTDITDVQKAEGYLAHKWGLEGNLPSGHPYKSSAP